ncbi:AAA family ATPase [Bacteroides sp.]
MRKTILRAKRTDNSNGVISEYANNNLTVDIRFSEDIIVTKELSVKVFTSTYHYMGGCTKASHLSDAIHRCRFNIPSVDEWTGGFYLVFVYCDSVPVLFTRLELADYDCIASKTELDPLNRWSMEYYFAGTLSDKSWWQPMDNGCFATTFIKQTVMKLQEMDFKRQDSGQWLFPPLLVVGDNPSAEVVAKSVLGEYAADGNEKAVYACSLEKFASGRFAVSELTTCNRRVVVISVESSEYDKQMVDDIHSLVKRIRNVHYPELTFIFYASGKALDSLTDVCPSFCGLFDENGIFNIKLNRDDSDVNENETRESGDEFERLLDEFIASEIKPCPEEEYKSPVTAEKRLEDMVGLSRLKSDIADARMMALFVEQRRALSLDTTFDNRHHMLFLGNPGTGKTTVAKLIGEMYHEMGLLSIGHTIETNRSKLVGEFIGQTEKNTSEIIEKARGGVLFIDEAYTLVNSEDDSKDFGKEVINSLLTVLSEPTPDMIVVLAGYEDKMQTLLRFNPGLQERFPLKFHFEDYTASELLEIAHRICKNRNFKLTLAADNRLSQLIEKAVLHRDEYFGNGRWVHNLIEHGVIKSMAKRVMSMPHCPGDSHLLSFIEESDIAEVERTFLQSKTLKLTAPRRIGFTA